MTVESLRSAAGQTTRLDIELATPGSRWRLRLSSPLRASDAEPAHDWLVPIMEPDNWLDDLLLHWPVQTATAETLLVREEEHDAVCFAGMERRSRGEGAARVPIARPEVVAAAVVGGREGAIEGLDYAGSQVFALAVRVRGTAWWLVPQIADGEVFERFDYRFATAALVLGAAPVLSFASGFDLLAAQRRRDAAGGEG